ncbi:hemerythrin domain-containing protein [Telmatospirillum sp. J64-1]|uniref:hemerythrin domain-containing protein n=1 Tax=Telmatospirillum sp. J64-1 TaxID=2502183 RepID=UPI00115E6D41|nr:hemerythrin domain-containing protein [Telmatospirillum sp. J64-1]
MVSIRFLDGLRTGHSQIDDSHRIIIDILNDISLAAEAGNTARCRELMIVFSEVCELHFAAEEMVLNSARFPGAEEHAQFHRQLLGRVRGFLGHFLDGADIFEIRDGLEELAGLIIDDVVKGDLSFRSYLIEKGLATP